MATIVEYSAAKRPENLYPRRIVSPPRSSLCCFSEMEEIGEARRDGRWDCVYRRCRECGFTVQVILRVHPDAGLVASLRREFQTVFRRRASGM